ncbi:MAG: DUF4294 domain-containing protein [Alistipes sp.]|nr:DUF4294 domain-containing protein [Alistipes sp.]
MKNSRLILLLLLLCIALPLTARRRGRGVVYQEWVVERGDSVPLIHLAPIRKYARKPDMRRYARMVRAVKKVYPIAQEAKRLMADMETELLAMPSKREQKLYIKGIQKRLIREYTPVLKKMTIYEGTILLKLIDRETQSTAFEIVKEFRGGFEAGFWQLFAKMFGNNLKTDYDPKGDDRMLEQIVTYYEKGLL